MRLKLRRSSNLTPFSLALTVGPRYCRVRLVLALIHSQLSVYSLYAVWKLCMYSYPVRIAHIHTVHRDRLGAPNINLKWPLWKTSEEKE